MPSNTPKKDIFLAPMLFIYIIFYSISIIISIAYIIYLYLLLIYQQYTNLQTNHLPAMAIKHPKEGHPAPIFIYTSNLSLFILLIFFFNHTTKKFTCPPWQSNMPKKEISLPPMALFIPMPLFMPLSTTSLLTIY